MLISEMDALQRKLNGFGQAKLRERELDIQSHVITNDGYILDRALAGKIALQEAMDDAEQEEPEAGPAEFESDRGHRDPAARRGGRVGPSRIPRPA
jgi:hypothetical protein